MMGFFGGGNKAELFSCESKVYAGDKKRMRKWERASVVITANHADRV